MRTINVSLAQQATIELAAMGLESMPLACGYLKAAALEDEEVRRRCHLGILNFGPGDSPAAMAGRVLREGPPDVAGFSVLGWSYLAFGHVSERLRSASPSSWIVWGGTHVSGQADRAFARFPCIDVIVNGAGERTFAELLRARLAGRSPRALHDVPGISFRDEAGQVVTTPPRPPPPLASLPSPILSGALPLTDPSGRFRYDVALMETNRGCPYQCGYCAWTAVAGRRVDAFPSARLEAEVELLAQLGVDTICLCDANFGQSRCDLDFLEILLRARERHGAPRTLIANWAKTKGPVFFELVRRMKETGFQTTFTLALQSLSPAALRAMGRQNMALNEWRPLVRWLRELGLEVYGELIWGCPDETPASFLAGYDELAACVTRVATYPNLLLPGTRFWERREELGIQTWRSEQDDFERVVAHRTMTLEENRQVHRFLFWARILVEQSVLRHVWAPLHALAGLAHSRVLLGLDAWLDRQDSPPAATLRACRAEVVERLDAHRYLAGLQFFLDEAEVAGELLARWWEEEVLPLVQPAHRRFFAELLRYDWLTRPIFDREAPERRSASIERVEVGGVAYYRRQGVRFEFDVPSALAQIAAGQPCDLTAGPWSTDLYWRAGFAEQRSIFNDAANERFYARTASQLAAA